MLILKSEADCTVKLLRILKEVWGHSPQKPRQFFWWQGNWRSDTTNADIKFENKNYFKDHCNLSYWKIIENSILGDVKCPKIVWFFMTFFFFLVCLFVWKKWIWNLRSNGAPRSWDILYEDWWKNYDTSNKIISPRHPSLPPAPMTIPSHPPSQDGHLQISDPTRQCTPPLPHPTPNDNKWPMASLTI